MSEEQHEVACFATAHQLQSERRKQAQRSPTCRQRNVNLGQGSGAVKLTMALQGQDVGAI